MIAFVVKDSADDEERRRAEAIVAAGAPKWSRKSSKSPARHVRPLSPFVVMRECRMLLCLCLCTDTASHQHRGNQPGWRNMPFHTLTASVVPIHRRRDQTMPGKQGGMPSWMPSHPTLPQGASEQRQQRSKTLEVRNMEKLVPMDHRGMRLR